MSRLASLAGLSTLSQQFQVNKYIRMGLSGIVAATGFFLLVAENINWVGLAGAKTGATIVMIVGLIKVAYGSLAPSSGSSTVTTGNSIITQVVPEGHTGPQV